MYSISWSESSPAQPGWSSLGSSLSPGAGAVPLSPVVRRSPRPLMMQTITDFPSDLKRRGSGLSPGSAAARERQGENDV